MNWAKENKFLTGFLVVLVIGILGLGYEVYSASAVYDDATSHYNQVAGEYSRLNHLAPYPNKENLSQFDVQKKDAAKIIAAFQADLAKKQFPLDPLLPERFQDQLKAKVTAIRTKAAEVDVKLPDKFFLGFEKYETVPPSDEAAPALGRQLMAIEWVVNQYLANVAAHSLISIDNIDRPELPEEKQAKTSGGGGGKGPGGGGPGRRELVKYYPFEVAATFRLQTKFNDVINTITGPQAPQFYVIRLIRIKNQTEKGPVRAVASATANTGKPDGPRDYLTGNEWIQTSVRYEIVDFGQPAEKAESTESPTPAEKPAATTEKPAHPVEKPAATGGKPSPPVEKPAAAAEKSASPAGKPAENSSPSEKPASTDKPVSPAKQP